MAQKISETRWLIFGWVSANLLGVAATGLFVLIIPFLYFLPGMLGSSLVIGLPFGFAQWFALRRIAPVSILWSLTISAGLFLGLLVINSPIPVLPLGFLDDESLLALTAAYTIIGFLVGLAQWLLLRGHFTRSSVWLRSGAVALGTGTGLVLAADLVNQSGIASIIIVFLLYALATGLTIAWLHPSYRKTGGYLASTV
jgi:hypothetical protein